MAKEMFKSPYVCSLTVNSLINANKHMNVNLWAIELTEALFTIHLSERLSTGN